MHRSRIFRPVLATFAAVALTACGGGDADTTAEAPEAVVVAPAPDAGAAAPAVAATGDTVTIQMLTTQNGASGVFEPAEITAKRGDVLRFVSDGGAAHNVSWPAAENPAGAARPAPSAYVVTPDQPVDQTVEVGPGSYNFQCDPHAPMGMKGKLTVTG